MSRYIDADILKDKTTRVNNIWNGTTNADGKGLDEIIDDIPTADVRENVKGKWIRCKMARTDKDESIVYYRNWKCNVCGYASNEEYDYCPYCGARMR